MHTRISSTAALLAIIIAPLALPAAASAGGWATVGLSSTPEDVRPGASWNVELEVLQHGRTPLDGVHPSITITSGGMSRTFPATPTGEPGFYSARVTFPRAGTWRYVVADGFTATHSYPPVQIGAPAATPAAGASDVAYDRLGLAALAALAAAALALLLPRRRRHATPAAGG